MSWYYSYYIGKKVDDKIELIGVYDNKGEIHPVLNISASFASDLKDMFFRYDGKELKDKMYSDYISILPYKDLPKGDFIKTGYYLIEDVERYLECGISSDLFYERISPEVYSQKILTESVLGTPENKKDDEGYEIEIHSCADYVFFAYPDYYSKEYEAFIIRNAVDILDPYSFKKDDIVIVMCQG